MGEKLVFARRPKSEPEPESDEFWRILVVDDDPEVHAVTRLALRSLRYSGRRAEILSAHSAAEARRVLAQGRPVAVILLDVVMETDDAGLQLVRHIRDKMKNAAVRIILRTGQPGQAPEEHVIVEYDINDYKAKTELTAQKLFTSVITALRAFRDITMLEAHQQGLRQVIECSDSLLKMRSLRQFASGVLVQLGAFLGVGAHGIVCVQRRLGETDKGIHVLAASNSYVIAEATTLAELPLNDEIAHAIQWSFENKSNHSGSGYTTLYLGDDIGQEIVAYIHCPPPKEDLPRNLVELFCSKISIGFSNLYLYEELVEANATLERKVDERTRQLAEVNCELERLATTDPLTGAANRRAFFAIAAREIDRMRRHSLPVAVALMDIDYFKRINDTLGHAAGDIVLKRLVERSQAGLRKVDLLGRLGGEEFAVLLPDRDRDGSLIVVERLRKALCDEPILLESGPLTVTASFGLTQLQPGENAELALARADTALYQAKESGRNRVVLA